MRVNSRQYLSILFVIFGFSCCFGQAFYKSWLPIRYEANVLYRNANDSAFVLLEDYLESAITGNRRKEIFQAYLVRADLFTTSLKSQEALNDLVKAEDYMDKNNPMERIQLKMTYGWFYDYTDAIPEAVTMFTEVYELAKDIGDKQLMSIVSNNLGTLLVLTGEPDKALEYLNDGLAYRLQNQKNTQDSISISVIYNSMGYANYYTEEYEKALACYLNCLEYNQGKDKNRYFKALIGAADCATNMGNYVKARELYASMQDYMGLINKGSNFIYYHLNYGRLLLGEEKYDSAEVEILQAIEYLDKNNLDQATKNILYKNLHKVYSAKKDFAKAYKYLTLYANIQDSLHTAESKKKLQRSLALFDAYKKDAKIANLSKEIESSTYVINSNKILLRIGLGLLAVFAVIGMYFFMKKREKENYSIRLEERIKRATEELLVTNKQLTETNAQLLAKNKEKTVLLREIHHRVKNNMQMIVSIIRVERKLDESINPEELLSKLENRIHSISEIHEKLYKPSGTNYKFINAKEFFDDVAYQIFRVFSPQHPGSFELNVDVESFTLAFDKVIQLGIILNELFANTFKYGFKDLHEGTIYIRLQSLNENEACFEYKDTGCGFPDKSLNKPEGTGFGKQIVDLLISQLDGEAERFNDNGAVVKIKFFKGD